MVAMPTDTKKSYVEYVESNSAGFQTTTKKPKRKHTHPLRSQWKQLNRFIKDWFHVNLLTIVCIFFALFWCSFAVTMIFMYSHFLHRVTVPGCNRNCSHGDGVRLKEVNVAPNVHTVRGKTKENAKFPPPFFLVGCTK